MREHSRDKVRLVFSQQIEKYLSETDWKTWNNSDWVLIIDAGAVFRHGVFPQFKDVGNLLHAERKMREDTDINFRVCQIGIRRLQIRYGVRMGHSTIPFAPITKLELKDIYSFTHFPLSTSLPFVITFQT